MKGSLVLKVNIQKSKQSKTNEIKVSRGANEIIEINVNEVEWD